MVVALVTVSTGATSQSRGDGPAAPHAALAPQRGATPSTAPWPEPVWLRRFPGVELTRLQVQEPRLAVLHVARVDLRTPCLHWLATPPADAGDAPIAPPGRHTPETIGLKTSTFLLRYGLQLAINAAPFGPVLDEEGLLMDVAGFQVSQGRPVSGPSKEYPALLMMRDGRVRIQPPPFPSEGVLTAVGGFDIVLREGIDVTPKRANPPVHPRTAVGISSDGHWLWLMVVDGRQPGYSLGATLHDLAAWLQILGASEGINLDGGGTTTMVIEGTDGAAEILNRPIHRNQPGQERVSASHLGLWVSAVATAERTSGTGSTAAQTIERFVCN